MTDFGNRLKQTMDEKGITASELSRLSGVGKNLISYYIHGRCLAKQDKVFLLARALGVNPGWLMTGVEQTSDCEQKPIVIPDSETFRKIVDYISPADYVLMMQIFERTYERMKEKGIEI